MYKHPRESRSLTFFVQVASRTGIIESLERGASLSYATDAPGEIR